MSGYAKFIKDLLIKKRIVSYETVGNLHHCSAITTRSLVLKKFDPIAFTISCMIGELSFAKFCDLRASINLNPLALYKYLVLKLQN